MLLFECLRLLSLTLLCSKGVFGSEYRISTASGFSDFVNNVNLGKVKYSGATVLLDSDLSFSDETLEPIGTSINTNYQFLGVFDGQGHIISDLKMNSSTSGYTGLFGVSWGLTIKNVVLDSSCSVTSSFSGLNDVYIGGIIGYCWAIHDQYSIEDIVNIANVTFSKAARCNNLDIGGISGFITVSGHDAYVKNCANYGSVTNSGISDFRTYLGGIVGHVTNYDIKYIQNCLNYGILKLNGTSSRTLYIGGIIGYTWNYTYIENCVSAGKIVTQTTASSTSYIGSIVGYISSSGAHINYCYYTNDVGANSLYEYGTPSSTTGTPTSPTPVGSDLVSNLNINATSCNWDKWLMLHLNGGRINNLAQDPLIGIQGNIPHPVKEGNSFLFWCKDADCTEEFDPETEPVSDNTVLYAAWVNNIVTFDFSNETTVKETFAYNTEIIYPDVKKEGYTLSWTNYHELMPAKDITVTAQWTPNNYTVSFDANGGSVSETSKIVTIDEKYGKLPETTKEKYMFIGWFTNETNGTEVTNETIVTTPDNHTLYAHWEEVTAQVEIVFGTKDLPEEEIEEIIKQYTTSTGFDIVKVEGEPGETRVIIKFTDTRSAEEFVRNIRESSGISANKVKAIDFTSGCHISFSSMLYPALLFNALLL